MSWEDDVDKLVGSSLRMLRTNAELTQGQLAEVLAKHDLPMSQQTIAKIENGTRSLRFVEAVAIVQVIEDARFEHLISTTDEIEAEMEAQRLKDELLDALGRLGDAAKDSTLWLLASESFIDDFPQAQGPSTQFLKALTKSGPAGIFNTVRAGMRTALEEGSYADEPTYRDAPNYVAPYLQAVEKRDPPLAAEQQDANDGSEA